MTPTLRLCLCDMNNGHANQASRCFSVLVESFFARVEEKNPGLECEFVRVDCRNKQEAPLPADLYMSSGGPGGPYDHDGEAWLDDYKRFLDGLVEGTLKRGPSSPSLLGVCYTFELLIRHFAVSKMEPRQARKFGVMPVYTTEAGMKHPFTQAFNDRLFAFEHRNWEAIDLDERKLRDLGGALLAQESRDGESKGRALLALDFAPGVEGTQFHPEADKPGVVAWLEKREQAEAFIAAYGHVTYSRMIKTLDNPARLAKTFALMIPGWLTRKFNHLAEEREWNLLDAPELDIALFDGDAPPAASVAHPSLFPPGMPKKGSVPRIPIGAFNFDDAPDSFSMRPLEKELDPAVADEGQSL